jgi:lipoprotein signal peptidase
MRHKHLAPLARIALLVAVVDYITKDVAVRWLAHEPAALNSWLSFAVVHNERGAFGWSLGAYTWHVNLAITFATIAFVVSVSRELSRVDKTAPLALGLIAGGATGNLASLILSPRGVVDFISLDFNATSIVLNVADVGAYVGLALVMRTGFLIVAAMRREVQPAIRSIREAPPLGVVLADREVVRPVFREPERAAEITPQPEQRPEITRPLSLDAAMVHPQTRMLVFPATGSPGSGLSAAKLRADDVIYRGRMR